MGMCVTPVPAVGDMRWGSAIPTTNTTPYLHTHTWMALLLLVPISAQHCLLLEAFLD